MNILILPIAEKQLRKLPVDIAKVILAKIYSIKDDPLSYIERLKGGSMWKLRIGDYRAILVISTKDSIINVIKIGHRKNIYKKL